MRIRAVMLCALERQGCIRKGASLTPSYYERPLFPGSTGMNVSADILDNAVPVISNAMDVSGPEALLDASVKEIYGHGMRDAGVVYTPPSIARYMCDKAISSYREHSNDLISVLDSSCGTGAFLAAAFDSLCEYGIKPGLSSLKEHIYGADIDAFSLEAAAARLLITLARKAPGVMIDINEVWLNLACGDTLTSPLPFGDRFPVIVGNPPYMRIKSMFKGAPDPVSMKKNAVSAYMDSGLYRYQQGNLNLYKLFIERNFGLLMPGGCMSLIFPSSFLNESTSERLRRHLFDEGAVVEVVELPEKSKAFMGVTQAAAILTCGKWVAGSFILKHGREAGTIGAMNGDITIQYDALKALTGGRMEVPLFRDPTLEWEMLETLSRHPPLGGSPKFPPLCEVSVGNVDETIDKAYISDSPDDSIFVKGIHISPYNVDLSPDGRKPRHVRKDDFLSCRPTAASIVNKPRLAGRNTQNKACARRLMFGPLPAGYMCGNSVKQLVVRDADLLYLLGMLNSSVMNWHFELFCSQNNIRNYRVEALPVPRPSRKVQDAFADVARAIITSSGDEKRRLDFLMDVMAFGLCFNDELITDDEATRRVINDRRFTMVRQATFKEAYHIS